MDKIISYESLPTAIRYLKSHGKITLLGGCFDILHPGHIEFLTRAKALGGQVIVMLESDESITAKKGKSRPINTQASRAKALSALEIVDYILPIPYLKTDLEYKNLVKSIEPDIIAITKGDQMKKIKEHQANMVGGRIEEVMERDPKFSTSTLIKK